MTVDTIKKLYTMKLHDVVTFGGGWKAIRVPGGWIYYHNFAGIERTATFVQWNNEFQPYR